MKTQEQIKEEAILNLMSACNNVYHNLKLGDTSDRFLLDYLQDRVNSVIGLLGEQTK
jgi:hypothetical protein